MIEMAIVSLLLFIMVFGAAELAFAWKSSSTSTNALRAAARIGATAGNVRVADHAVLRTLGAGLADLPGGRVDRIVVYRATDADGEVPDACLTDDALSNGGVTNLCNVYRGSVLDSLDITQFSGETCDSLQPDRHWCPLDRSIAIGSADYLGVWVRIEAGWLTNLLPSDGYTITDHAVTRLEPDI